MSEHETIYNIQLSHSEIGAVLWALYEQYGKMPEGSGERGKLQKLHDYIAESRDLGNVSRSKNTRR